MDERKEVTLQVEWVESLLLFQSTYSKYDDVTRMHNFQMRYDNSDGTLLCWRDEARSFLNIERVYVCGYSS